MTNLKIEIQKEAFAVHRLSAQEPIPSWATSSSFFSITKTRDELSIVCVGDIAPATVKVEKGWRSLKVQGPLAFSEVGILAVLSDILAKAKVSIFVISTFDTDYILVKEIDLKKATAALITAGVEITGS